jgi:acyl carrier protein
MRDYTREVVEIVSRIKTGSSQGDPEEYDLTGSVLAAGILDSFGFVQMIVQIEEHFAIRFTDDEMQSEEIESVLGLVSLLEKREL